MFSRSTRVATTRTQKKERTWFHYIKLHKRSGFTQANQNGCKLNWLIV